MLMDQAEDMMEEDNPNEDSMLLDGLLQSDRSTPSKQTPRRNDEKLKKAEKLLGINLDNLSN